MAAYDPEGDASMDGVQEEFRVELIEPADAGDTEPGDLVERLKSPLPVCPFDRRSPDYWTAGNDGKPCHVCGGTEEVDKCRGADTRVMDEAAEALSSLRAERDAAVAKLSSNEKAMDIIDRAAKLLLPDVESAESSLAAEKQRVVDLERKQCWQLECMNRQATTIFEYIERVTSELARIAALEGALTPFARLDMPAAEKWTCGTFLIEHSDIRTARAALRPAETVG